MKVAAAQIACVVGDIAANTEKIRAFAARAKEAGAELVVFPETSDIGYSLTTIKQLAVSLSQGAVPELKEIARQVSIVLVCGVCEREGDSIFNTQVVIAPAGEMVVKYRKTHLFSLSPFSESECFTAGKELTTHRIGDFIFGLSICYDFRFPELYRVLAIHKQANVLLNSSAHPFPRLDHLRAVVLRSSNRGGVGRTGRVNHCRYFHRSPPMGAGTDAGIRESAAGVVLLKRAVEHEHAVGRAAVFVETNVGAVEIERAIRLKAAFGIDRKPVGNFPFQAAAGAHFAIGKDGMI